MPTPIPAISPTTLRRPSERYNRYVTTETTLQVTRLRAIAAFGRIGGGACRTGHAKLVRRSAKPKQCRPLLPLHRAAPARPGADQVGFGGLFRTNPKPAQACHGRDRVASCCPAPKHPSGDEPRQLRWAGDTCLWPMAARSRRNAPRIRFPQVLPRSKSVVCRVRTSDESPPRPLG
jgi:hypothetical protein